MFIQGKCSDSPSRKKRGGQPKSNQSSPKKKVTFFSVGKENPLSNSRIKTEIKTASKNQFKTDKSPSTSLGRTATSSMSNLLRENSTKKRSVSQSTELVKKLQINE